MSQKEVFLIDRKTRKMNVETRTSRQWESDIEAIYGKGLLIINPDGWNKTDFGESFYVEQITKDEFLKRLLKSTISVGDFDMNNLDRWLEMKPLEVYPSKKLLFHLVDIVWGSALENESVPSTDHAKMLIQKAVVRMKEEDKKQESKLRKHIFA